MSRRTRGWYAVLPALGLASAAWGQSEAATGQTGDSTAEPPIELTTQQVVQIVDEMLDRIEAAGESKLSETSAAELTRLLEGVRARDLADPWLPYLYGRALTVMGRRGDARDQLRKFIETREGRSEWRAHRVLADLLLDEFPRLAKSYYDKAAALKQNEPSVLLGLSLCAGKLAEHAQAVTYAQRAVAAVGRGNLLYVSQLARSLMAERRWPEAQKEADAALELALAAMRSRAGQRTPLLAVDEQYRLAIEIAQERSNQSPEAGEHYVRLADLMRKREQIRVILALHDILGLVEAGVRNAGAKAPAQLLEQYAVLLAEVGRNDEARARFEELLQKDPSNAAAKDWLGRLPAATSDSSSP